MRAASLFAEVLVPRLAPLMGLVGEAAGLRSFAARAYEARHGLLSLGGPAEEVALRWDGTACAMSAPNGDDSMQPTHAELVAAADKVVQHAETAEDDGRRLAPEVLLVVVSDYVESLASWAVGDAKAADAKAAGLLRAWASGTFVSDCLLQPARL